MYIGRLKYPLCVSNRSPAHSQSLTRVFPVALFIDIVLIALMEHDPGGRHRRCYTATTANTIKLSRICWHPPKWNNATTVNWVSDAPHPFVLPPLLDPFSCQDLTITLKTQVLLNHKWNDFTTPKCDLSFGAFFYYLSKQFPAIGELKDFHYSLNTESFSF